MFIAFHKGTQGRNRWYLPPGPDYRPKAGEPLPETSLAYEFLLNRKRFETLGERYR